MRYVQNTGSTKKNMKNPIPFLYLENYLFAACKNKAEYENNSVFSIRVYPC